jgi:hypothetical protein
MPSCSATKAARKRFPENDLPALLADIPLAIKEHTWLMHNGVSPHFSLTALELLDSKYATQYDTLAEDDVFSAPPPHLISIQSMLLCRKI